MFHPYGMYKNTLLLSSAIVRKKDDMPRSIISHGANRILMQIANA